MSKFEIYLNGKEYRYRLKAPNGEIILVGEAYTSKQSCKTGIESVRANSGFDVRYIRLLSIDKQPYFNLKAANGEIIGTSEMYSSVHARETGIEAVKKHACLALMEDKTI